MRPLERCLICGVGLPLALPLGKLFSTVEIGLKPAFAGFARLCRARSWAVRSTQGMEAGLGR